jgi:exo-beta-1,3-glucanase (GH17 family)
MAITVVLACLLSVILAQAWLRGRPVSMEDASVTTLPCVSYAPFRRTGSTPLVPEGAVSAEKIEDDLIRLKTLTNCVRTYGVAQGLEAVPGVARKLGMRVRQGVWLGRDDAANRTEIDRAIALTREFGDVIDVLIVGNEVLLRRDLNVEQLSGYLRAVKARTEIAVTYADVWEFWLRHAVLQTEVDWVTVHILPYWEDVPVAARDAANHVFTIADDMRKAFPDKPIWVGETGWPAAGRQRAGARPGVVEQTLLIRQLASRATTEGPPINTIEAFDQPWKRALEGAMGGAWGLFAADGTPRMTLRGQVVEDRDGWMVWAGAGAGLLVAVIAIWRANRNGTRVRQRASLAQAKLTVCLATALIGAAASLHIAFIALWSRSAHESITAYAIAAVVLTATIVMLYRFSSEPQESLRNTERAAQSFAWAQIALLFVAASWALILVADPRYRGFPIALFAPPAALAAGFALRHKASNNARSYLRYELLFLSWALMLATAVMVIQEGVSNTEALALATCWALLALPSIVDAMTRPRQSDASEQ